MSLVAFPTPIATPARKRFAWLALPAIALVAGVAYWAIFRTGSAPTSPDLIGQVVLVKPIDVEVKVTQKGELQAINNIDIVCLVEGQTTIQTIVPEGAAVKKGDVLVTLDSSAIKQKIEDSTLDLQKAQSDLVASRELKEIQESQNATNLEAAQVALKQAQLDLQGYTEGSYPQQLKKCEADLKLAQIALKSKQETLAQTQALFNKGFVNAADVKTAESDVVKAQIDSSTAQNALDVLAKYTHESDLAAKNSALSQGEQKLVRTQRENAANLNQKVADVSTKEQNLAVLKRRMEHLQDQLEACTIKAPADGMVVYSTSSDRWSQNPIQEGATVRERQAILRLPDTSGMKAVVRVGEAQVSKLSEGQRALVSIGSQQERGTISKISVLTDNSQRWMNPDVKEYPVDIVLDRTPPNLKPGMTAQADIFVSRASSALAVPLQALYSAGNDSYVFVPDGDHPRGWPVKVKLGLINETHAQVTSGLSPGQNVRVLEAGEGRDLLEQAGMKIEAPATRSSDSDYVNSKRRGGGGREGRDGKGTGAPPVSGGPGAPGGPGSQDRPPRDRERNQQQSPAANPPPTESNPPSAPRGGRPQNSAPPSHS